jgi:hypothetical protein
MVHNAHLKRKITAPIRSGVNSHNY